MSEPTSDPKVAKPASTGGPIAPPPPEEFDLLAFWIQYRRLIIRVFSLVAVVLIAVFGYRLYEHLKETNSRNALADAKSLADFQNVAAKYEGTNAGATALLMAAQDLRNANKHEEASKIYGEFVAKYPEHSLAPGATTAQAVTLENAGKADEAIGAFQKVVSGYASSSFAPLALAGQARVYKAQNKLEDARRVLTELQTKYPNVSVAA